MKLAIVVFTVISPGPYEGHQFQSLYPEPCAEFSDHIIEIGERRGLDLMAQCFYTFAPQTSPKPNQRPWRDL